MSRTIAQTKSDVYKMIRLVDCIRKEINDGITQQQLSMFLMVAHNEGTLQGELAKILGLPEASVSRNLRKLGTKYRKTGGDMLEKTGYGLMESRQDDYTDNRKRSVYLTKKGSAVIQRLCDALSD